MIISQHCNTKTTSSCMNAVIKAVMWVSAPKFKFFQRSRNITSIATRRIVVSLAFCAFRPEVVYTVALSMKV